MSCLVSQTRQFARNLAAKLFKSFAELFQKRPFLFYYLLPDKSQFIVQQKFKIILKNDKKYSIIYNDIICLQMKIDTDRVKNGQNYCK